MCYMAYNGSMRTKTTDMRLRWVGLTTAVIAAAAMLFVWHASRPRPVQHIFMVEIEPQRVEIRPMLTHGKVSRFESFSEAMARLKPYAAINGTFYGTQMEPLGDMLLDGKLINRGRYPNAIAVRGDGTVRFIRSDNARFNLSGYKAGLAAGPRLIRGGKVKIDMTADGFSRRGLSIIAPRSGVGLTSNGKLLLVVETRPVTLAQFGDTMLDLGCTDALNLDGGPACGLYHDGKILVNATLRMTNLLVFYKK